MLNGKGYDIEEVTCQYCLETYECAPDDPTDLCECPDCIEMIDEIECPEIVEMIANQYEWPYNVNEPVDMINKLELSEMI